MFPGPARKRRQQTLPALLTWPSRFHSLAHGQAPARCVPRATPIALFCLGSFSCVLPADRFAFLFFFVHSIDFGSETRVDGVAAQLAISGEQPASRSERIANHFEISDLPVMREFAIHHFERRLNRDWFNGSVNEPTKVAAAIPDDHH